MKLGVGTQCQNFKCVKVPTTFRPITSSTSSEDLQAIVCDETGCSIALKKAITTKAVPTDLDEEAHKMIVNEP